VCENQVAKDITFMKCPFCQHDIAAAWQPLGANTDYLGRPTNQFSAQLIALVRRNEKPVQLAVTVQWLQCQNTDCKEIIVQITRIEGVGAIPSFWIALPKHSALPVLNQLITDPWRKDYLEAWKILEDSPRMSAVLSRRILGDLLVKYAGAKQYSFAARVDAFIADTKHPLHIRQNLHYLREMGDFGAHTQVQQTPAGTPNEVSDQVAEPIIIDVDQQEAAWTLRVISDLFEHFIVAPQKDEEMRKAFDKKMADANRKPIKPLTE
jgi:hypothetical protein